MGGPSVTVPAARLERDASGTTYSPEFEDIYHSAQGGLAQARHVFLAGNGLPARWRGADDFTIVETGFGIGLNFLATWKAARDDGERPKRLHFVSVENRPFVATDLFAALAPFTELGMLARELASAWPPLIAGYHRLHFDRGRVILTLLFGEASDLLPQLVARADAFFLDGFAPAKNPQLWSPAIVRELARLAAPGATLATWTVAGGVRAALAGAGFAIEKQPGFGAKREMLTGRFPGERSRATRDRRAIVVGGGLAGTIVSERLASREWSVDCFEARRDRTAPAVGLLRPIANLRDALNARLSRSAFLYSLQHFRTLEREHGLVWKSSGALQLAKDAAEAERFEVIATSQGYPEEFITYVDAGRATAIAGREVRGAGWWYPHAALVSPSSDGQVHVARAGARLARRIGEAVFRIERHGELWRAFDEHGALLAQAPVVILSNAADAARLLPEARLRVARVRGQLTYLPPNPRRTLDVVVSGDGYVAPRFEGGHAIGATYQHEDEDALVRAHDHRENLARAESMLPGFTRDVHPMRLEGWTGFRTTVPDRLPIFGATRAAGACVATGLGSRGLLWAPLGAELIASELEGEPLPLPRDYAGAISPQRFLS